MSCLVSYIPMISLPAQEDLPRVIEQQKQAQTTAKVTAIGLFAIALVLFAFSCFMWGKGTSPAMMLTGVNFIPYLVGSFMVRISLGVAAAGLLFGAKMLYHTFQIYRATHGLNQPSS